MFIDFMTRRNVNGNRYYLRIATGTNEYSRMFPSMIPPDGVIEITKRDYDNLIKKLKFFGFKEVECLYY